MFFLQDKGEVDLVEAFQSCPVLPRWVDVIWGSGRRGRA